MRCFSDPHRGKDFAFLQGCLPGADNKRRNRNCPRSTSSAGRGEDFYVSRQDVKRRQGISGRRGGAEIPPDRPHVADLGRPELLNGSDQNRKILPDGRMGQQRGMCHAGADAYGIHILPDGAQFLDPLQTDQDRKSVPPGAHLYEEVRSARQ